MFITVKYGEKEEALFNPNCKILLLLENIKLRCNCTDDVDVDLSDDEGNVKHLIEAPARYANEVLKGRDTFVLVKVERNDESQKPSYVPLLNDSEAIDAAFLARLSTKDSSGSGSAKGRKKRGSKDGSKEHKNRGSGKTTPTLGRKTKQR